MQGHFLLGQAVLSACLELPGPGLWGIHHHSCGLMFRSSPDLGAQGWEAEEQVLMKLCVSRSGAALCQAFRFCLSSAAIKPHALLS